MHRAPSLIAKSALLLAWMVAASAVTAAGNSPSANARRASNSFNLYVTAAPQGAATVVHGPGAGVASGKAVITNPYNVPLIQNAGSLHSGR